MEGRCLMCNNEPKASSKYDALMEIILGRRSIRKYKDKPISREEILCLLEAAIWAPNGENYQPWKFIVITDRNIIKELGLIGARASGRRFLQEFLRGDLEKRLAAIPEEKRQRVIKKMIEGRVSGFVAEAPLCIAVCSVGYEGVDNLMDCSAATQNLLLAAEALGIGACWVIGATKDARDQKKVRELLKVPRGVHVPYIISLGYPDEAPRPRPRKPLDEVVYYNFYNQGGDSGGQ